jgi:hypothetical protein
MDFSLQELYDFANVSSPGGNHYTIQETERVWNTEKGRHLSSLCDPSSFYQHFIMVHIYGAMAQRYSGVFDTRESYCYGEAEALYDLLSKSIFPFGYRFYTLEKESGYQLIIQKDDEPLQNMDARIGIEYYNDIPDKVHRPPYYIKPYSVSEDLSCSLLEHQYRVKNRNTWKLALEKLRSFAAYINQNNLKNYIDNCSIEKIKEIYHTFDDEIEYYEDEENMSQTDISVDEMKKFIMEFDYKSIKNI